MVVELILGLGYIVATLLGVYIGYKLSDRAIRQHAKEQGQRAYTLLRLEIDQNLVWLDDFWRNKVDAHLEGLSDEIAFQRRLHLIQAPLPIWSHLMWTSQAAVLPLALSEEQIKAVFHFHAQLERLTTLRSSISEVLPSSVLEEYNAWRAYPLGDRKQIDQWFVPIPPEGKRPYTCPPLLDEYLKQFNNDTFSLWGESESIRDELFTGKNPLPALALTDAKPKLLVRLRRKGTRAKQL